MKAEESNKARNEQELVKLYMDLTGCSESGARSVLMHLEPEGGEAEGEPRVPEARPGAEIRPETGESATSLLLVLACLLLSGAGAAAQTNRFAPLEVGPNLLAQPLSLVEAVDIALRQNPSVLQAQKDVEAAQGVVIQTRAIALPKVGVTGTYNAVANSDIDQLPGFSVAFGSDQTWRSQVRLVQSVYEGGRMVSAYRVASLTTERSMLNYRTVLADAVALVQVSYYDVLLAEQQITVQKASVELLESVLANETRRFDAGTVTSFNVLRAKVELANAKPKLIQAQNRYRVSKNVLVNLLGYNLPPGTTEEIPLRLSGKLEAEPYDIDFTKALKTAFQRRTELAAQQKSEQILNEGVKTAKAGYKPSLQVFAGYDIHSSMFSNDLGDEFHGWLAGAQMTWNIFDGFATRGKVAEAQALYERSGVESEELRRRVELDVRSSYSTFIESREVLDSTTKAVEQAVEAVRLARSRYDAGAGTQLDVLSAQTALTDARTTQVQALRDYEVARARLDRAVGMNIPEINTAKPESN